MVAYDLPILPKYQVPGHPTVDRCYLLLDENVQLIKTVTFDGALKGWWYVDLIEIEEVDRGLVVHDMYVDFLIPPAVDRYQILDLEELGESMADGKVTPGQCAEVLAATQRFVHRYLRGAEEGPVGPASAFPPATVEYLAELPPF
ncbi:hypothetical protein GCM10009804_52670 [Kribbella hippodromi]|uniref:DUF402 domain-containing protein n=1 Tax=Kribbella hippodromi TaxID=434347 RepID=A0ABP4PUT2_9ACTN